ncbi:unnamed protein product [Sphagnum jensenii]|uniref:SREBP regulating gene protein n=1 Tax=Sphagnum jensenii TaxID=128206 RepID=A0ABP1AAV3_9BRYO
MKIPAASCNLFLLFLFFIFCHLDLCSSLRLIGDPSKLPHVALRTDEVECNNTVQGRYLLSDSRGYVCSIMAVNSATSCCPEVGKQYSCHGCELVSRCCDSYEYCVACCMDPARTVVEVALKTKVARQATARTCSSLFEFCSGRCRHNSQSVVHENAYANELHHCFSEQLNPSGESGDPAVETKLTDLTIIAARQGQSCDAACKGRRLSCAADKLSEINNCSELQSYMKCRGLCVASSGPDQPAEVVSTAPKHLHPGACLFNTQSSLLSCQGSHPYTRRLCPCS